MITMTNVTKTYKSGDVETYALKDDKLTIEEGEFVVILGPSGSGKSTLLNVISGLDTVTSGEITFRGETLTNMDEEEMLNRVTVEEASYPIAAALLARGFYSLSDIKKVEPATFYKLMDNRISEFEASYRMTGFVLFPDYTLPMFDETFNLDTGLQTPPTTKMSCLSSARLRIRRPA